MPAIEPPNNPPPPGTPGVPDPVPGTPDPNPFPDGPPQDSDGDGKPDAMGSLDGDGVPASVDE